MLERPGNSLHQACKRLAGSREGDQCEALIFTPGPSPEALVNLVSPSAFDPTGGQTTLTLTDLHDASFSSAVQYEIPFTATGEDIIQSASVRLLVNRKQEFLPVLVKTESIIAQANGDLALNVSNLADDSAVEISQVGGADFTGL